LSQRTSASLIWCVVRMITFPCLLAIMKSHIALLLSASTPEVGSSSKTNFGSPKKKKKLNLFQTKLRAQKLWIYVPKKAWIIQSIRFWPPERLWASVVLWWSILIAFNNPFICSSTASLVIPRRAPNKYLKKKKIREVKFFRIKMLLWKHGKRERRERKKINLKIENQNEMFKF